MSFYRKRMLVSEKKRLLAVREYIINNLDKDLSCQALATQFGYSDSTIKRQFTLLFKVSIGRFVLQQRMGHARKLVLDQELPIGEIGCRVGYRNRSAFTNAFTKYFGVSPVKVNDGSVGFAAHCPK